VVSAADSNADGCSISGEDGLLLDDSCYLLVASSEIQQQTGVSWFKAVSHCASLDSSLASIKMDSDSSDQLATYLKSKDVDDDDPVWIGLNRRPWVWLKEFNPGKSSSSSTSVYHYQFFPICFIIVFVVVVLYPPPRQVN